ncbi:hypothetical protein [Nitrincola sp. MINF-07-Sa-05]|uniref:hypothetical protein n=1 Tax=Nitrincola salilacus TaxID=3400273 RepID=UPI0039180E40
MVDSIRLELQVLDAAVHDRDRFDCSMDGLNKWFKTQAAKAAKRNLSRTKVLVSPAEPALVLGFYTLSNCMIHSLPRYPQQGAPALLLGKMAVDRAHQRNRLGEQLLLAAIRDTAYVAVDTRLPPVIGLVVDPKEGVADFYLGYGFTEVEMNDGAVRLFMPVSTCLRVAEEIQ